MLTIRPKYQDFDTFIVVDKPSGVSTHKTDNHKDGLIEVLSEFEERSRVPVVGPNLSLGMSSKLIEGPFWVVHRLDQGTSGLILFAKTKKIATDLGLLFEKALVKRTYFFLTDRYPGFDKKIVKSSITRKGNRFASDRLSAPNSETYFELVSKAGAHYLWKAQPMTAKPDQIRLHAHDSQMPVLGDLDYGGTPFLRLALHSAHLEFSMNAQNYLFTSELPFWAKCAAFDLIAHQNNQSNLENVHSQKERLEPGYDYDDMTLDYALERRQRFLKFDHQDSLRLSHNENQDFRIDQYGSVIWVYWYKDTPPNQKQTKRFAKFASRSGKSLYLRTMLNRGKDPNSQNIIGLNQPPETWIAFENDVAFELRSSSGLSPGLFLDQRENRYWIQKNTRDKSVLNLFAYTGGFSVNAALGGARRVVTVDLSKNFIEWTQRNFELNQIQKSEKLEFWSQDCFVYLKGAIKKKKKFDIIICDPPSFSRSKDRIFRIDKDLLDLLALTWSCLESQGYLLLSTNYEGWTQDQFQKLVLKTVSKLDGGAKLCALPPPPVDFVWPAENFETKFLLIRKLAGVDPG